MPTKALKSNLDKLRRELADPGALDEETRRELADVANTIEKLLQADSPDYREAHASIEDAALVVGVRDLFVAAGQSAEAGIAAVSRLWDAIKGGGPDAVQEAIGAGHHLIVQAGTGTGKSFGYLVPAALQAVEDDQAVIVATATLALQRQLVEQIGRAHV